MMKMLAVMFVLFAARDLGAGPPPRTILVLPFENRSARKDLGWISESFVQTLAARLAGSDRIALDREDRDEACEQLGLPPGTPLTLASVFKVAQALGADWAVTGSFSVEGGTLTSQAYWMDVPHFRRSGPLEASGALADLVELQTRLAWRILALQDEHFTVGSVEDFQRQFPVLRLDAHENYIRGILASDAETRVRFFSEADRRDPSDRRAALELGRLYYEKKDYEAAAQWLRKLEAGGADSFEARFMMGVTEFFLGRDAAAEQIFLDLSRQAPLNEVWNNLGFMQARRGRWQEATVSFDRAYQGDPADPEYSFNLGVCMWNGKQHAVAIRYFREAAQSAPDDPEIHRLLGEALAATGDAEGKRREEQWLEERGENSTSGTSGAILPHPRLRKHFDRRAYRQLTLAARAAREVQLRRAPAPAEAKP